MEPEEYPAPLAENERKAIATAILMAVIGTLLAVGVSLWYTAKTDAKAERRTAVAIKEAEKRQAEDLRRWCGILKLLDDRNQQLPPSTDSDTNKFRSEIHDLRQQYGC